MFVNLPSDHFFYSTVSIQVSKSQYESQEITGIGCYILSSYSLPLQLLCKYDPRGILSC